MDHSEAEQIRIQARRVRTELDELMRLVDKQVPPPPHHSEDHRHPAPPPPPHKVEEN